MCDAYFFRFSEFLFNFVFVNNLKLLKIMRTKNLCLLLAFLFSLPIVIEAKNKKINKMFLKAKLKKAINYINDVCEEKANTEK